MAGMKWEQGCRSKLQEDYQKLDADKLISRCKVQNLHWRKWGAINGYVNALERLMIQAQYIGLIGRERHCRQRSIRFLMKVKVGGGYDLDQGKWCRREARRKRLQTESVRDQRRVDKREELRNSLEDFVGVMGNDPTINGVRGKKRWKQAQHKNQKPFRTILGIFPFYIVSTVLSISEVQLMFVR